MKALNAYFQKTNPSTGEKLNLINKTVLALVCFFIISSNGIALDIEDLPLPHASSQYEESGESNEDIEEKKAASRSTFKVVGYLNGSVDNWDYLMDQAPVDQLTDIIFAFIHPDKNGDFILDWQQRDKMTSAVAKARQNNLRVHLSFGGGDVHSSWNIILNDAKKRTNAVNNLRKLVIQYNFDGLDVDLENALVNTNYNLFVRELSQEIKKHNKLLSAALVKHSSKHIWDDVLHMYDFINIMGYDFAFEIHDGTTPRPHSSLWELKDNYNYYRSRNIPASKIVLGVPAYAHGWNGKKGLTRDYKSIVAAHPNAYALNFQREPTTGLVYFYDGHPAIRAKVKFALDVAAAGMMMWQIMGDTQDKTSLLKLINYTKNNPNGFYPTSYDIANKIQGKLLEVENASTANGANILLSNTTASNANVQTWNIQHQYDSVFALKNVHSNQYMDVAGHSTADEANILQWPWNNRNNQKFILSSDNNGYYFIKSVHSGKRVTVQGWGGGAGSNVYQLTPSRIDRQKWVFMYNN